MTDYSPAIRYITSQLNVGNIYVNRNQIGAVVGSQPFGGEGLSGTGPKAGGPNYLKRFTTSNEALLEAPQSSINPQTYLPLDAVQSVIEQAPRAAEIAISTIDLPGPTGESNRLSEYPRGTILCLGPTLKAAQEQIKIAKSKGCTAIAIHEGASGDNSLDGVINPDALSQLNGINGVAYWANTDIARKLRQALAQRDGPILPLIGPADMDVCCILERHVCVDTTAAGGNVALLSGIT